MELKTTKKKIFYDMVIAILGLFTLNSCTEESIEMSNAPSDQITAVGDAVSITNPGFESNWNGWADTDPSSISGDSNSGSNSAKITGSGGRFDQSLSVKANTNYTLSAHVLGSWRIGAEFGSNRQTRSGNASDWKKESVTFNTGSSTTLTILGEHNSGEGRFDDFELIEGAGIVSNSDNLAIGGTASQSSNYSSSLGLAGNAIDGDTNGNWNNGSVTHTQTGVGQWWKVDLGSNQSIGDIVLYNRTNCCKDRLDNVTVSVENTSGTVLWSENVTSNSVNSLTVNAQGTSGRVIKVTQNSNKPLSLAEVEVFEGEAGPSVCSFGNSAIPSGNLAYGKSTNQSSTYTGDGGESCKAVDGNTSGNWGNGSVTHTQTSTSPWWEVDLGSNENVGDIVIFNRTGCCTSRLSNFTVSLLTSNGSTAWSTNVGSLSGSSITLDANGATGSKVRITIPGSNKILSLAEVQVFEDDGGNNGGGSLDPNKSPGENFDLSKWKITLSSAQEKTTEDLVGGYELSNQFYTDPNDGGMVFKNYPKGAGTTTTSTYSRVEFREMLRGTEDWWDATYPNEDYPNTSDLMNNWVFSSSSASTESNAGGVDGTMTATLKVNSVTTTSSSSAQNGRIIIGQIHASGNEPIRLYYHKQPNHQNGAIYFAHEPNTGNERFYNMLGSNYVDTCDGCDSAGDYQGAGNPSNGIGLNEEFSYTIKVVNNLLEVFLYDDNGTQIGYEDINMSSSGFANDYMYFKAGVYSGDKSTQSSTDFQQVTFYQLDVTHD